MSNVEVKVDNNMNKTSNDTQKIEPAKDADLEKGGIIPSNEFPWNRLIVMVLALGVLVAACSVAWVFQDWQASLLVLVILVVVYCIAFYWRWICIAIRTAPRDLSALYCYVKILLLTRKFTKKNWSMPDIFHQMVKKHPNKACFLFENEIWSFQQVEQFSLRVSAVLKDRGVKRGDTVGVMLNNCPELPAIWIGAARIGAVCPLINTNQTGNTLLHSVKIAKCDVVIYGLEFQNAFHEVSKELDPTIKLFMFTRRPLNTSDSVKVAESPNDFTSMLETTAPSPWTLADGEGFNGKLLYIYTSGTTGLPKAAVISSARMVFMASGVHYLGSLRTSDVIYCPMPLYHSAGGCITVGQSFIFGCTVAIRTKFSASQYFPDCIKFNATAAHYIGEMCRYVLATPPAATDRQHKVRTVYGNGMRPTIWNDFVKRFNIKKVVEFYGATEGNANIVNIDNRSGAIGFVSRIIPSVYPIAILKVNQETGEPIRDAKGLCQLAKPHEPGVFIGKIKPNNPSRAFLGYVDKEASDKKIVRDVFTYGDSAFISGDILVADELGYLYFRDRTGDTFRWRGENVSTTEVEAAVSRVAEQRDAVVYGVEVIISLAGDILVADELGYLYFRDRTGDTFRWRGENVSTTEVEAAVSRVAEQRDAVVYGVEIPNTDGRAGMCGIVDVQGTLDLDKLLTDMSKDLPKYARPVFIRLMTSIDMTGTFKLRKVDLQKEGYNPTVVKDRLYYLDPKLNKYVSLGDEEYNKIISGQIRL